MRTNLIGRGADINLIDDPRSLVLSPRGPLGARDSPVENIEFGVTLVWGFSCQVVIFGLLAVLCS